MSSLKAQEALLAELGREGHRVLYCSKDGALLSGLLREVGCGTESK